MAIVKLFSLDVEAGERQTLARGCLRLLLINTDFSYALAEWNRTGIGLERLSQSRDGPVGRLVFEEKISIEQGRIDLADMLC
jgi:predicted Zn-dependent protease